MQGDPSSLGKLMCLNTWTALQAITTIFWLYFYVIHTLTSQCLFGF